MRLKDLSESTSDLFNLPIAALEVDPAFNVREDSEALRDHVRTLAADMMANGFLRSKPLTVRLSGDRAIVVDGHCRLAAVHLAIADGAEILTVPCLPEAKGTSEAERSLMLIKANTGLPLQPLEQAAVVKRLLSFGWSEAQIGAKLGRSRQHVMNLLDLAGAPEPVRAMVAAGRVSATEAVKVVRRDGDAACDTLAKAAAKATANGKAKVTPQNVRDVSTPEPVHEPETLTGAVRAFLTAWDDPNSGRVSETVAALRALVG